MANRRATSRTAAGTLDSMSRDPMLEGLEELLAGRGPRRGCRRNSRPWRRWLWRAMMERIAIKYADLNLAREANSLHKEALSALKKRQSALNSQPETNSGGRERPPTPAPDQKSLKDRARLPSPSEQDDLDTEKQVAALQEAREGGLAGKG